MRLALWGLLLFGVMQIVVSVVVFVAISTWLGDQVDDNLLLTATQVSSVLYDPEDAQNPLDIADVQLQLADNNVATQSFLTDKLFFVRLIDLATGEVLVSSAAYDVPVSANQLSGTTFETVRFAEEDDLDEVRVYTLHLSYAPQFALQAGVSLEETREIERDVLRILLVLLAFTGTMAPLSGWFLANRALVPIRATTQTAATIHETDLSRRIDLNSSEVELAQLVQTFNAMLDRIEGAFQRQKQFTADAAHELRTPLSIMQTGLEVTLSKERDAQTYQNALMSVQEEVQRLTALANTLLRLARTDNHDLMLERQTVDLSLLVDMVVEQFSARADDKQILLRLEIAPNLRVEGDEDRLIQVVFNLLDNALKYTPDGGEVRVVAMNDGDAVAIRVEDSGQGIPVEEQARIFDRFYRLDSARSRVEGGFGLGLAIAKRVVTLHGGTIEVHNKISGGAVFTVRLPL